MIKCLGYLDFFFADFFSGAAAGFTYSISTGVSCLSASSSIYFYISSSESSFSTFFYFFAIGFFDFSDFLADLVDSEALVFYSGFGSSSFFSFSFSSYSFCFSFYLSIFAYSTFFFISSSSFYLASFSSFSFFISANLAAFSSIASSATTFAAAA